MERFMDDRYNKLNDDLENYVKAPEPENLLKVFSSFHELVGELRSWFYMSKNHEDNLSIIDKYVRKEVLTRQEQDEILTMICYYCGIVGFPLDLYNKLMDKL